MPKKFSHPAEVNSSLSIIFLISTVGLSFVYFWLMGESHDQTAIVVLLFALFIYLMWDFVKQLYEPAQAFALYSIVFFILPVLMNLTLGYPYARDSGVIFFASFMLAIFLDFIYDRVVKDKLPKKFRDKLLQFDATLDKAMIHLSDKHLVLSEYRGFVCAIVLTAAFYGLSYLLLSL